MSLNVVNIAACRVSIAVRDAEKLIVLADTTIGVCRLRIFIM